MHEWAMVFVFALVVNNTYLSVDRDVMFVCQVPSLPVHVLLSDGRGGEINHIRQQRVAREAVNEKKKKNRPRDERRDPAKRPALFSLPLFL